MGVILHAFVCGVDSPIEPRKLAATDLNQVRLLCRHVAGMNLHSALHRALSQQMFECH
jgi:hypothetical protein